MDVAKEVMVGNKGNIPFVIAHPKYVTALAYWRLLWPLYQLSMRGEVAYSIFQNFMIDYLPYGMSDVAIFQRLAGKNGAGYIKHLASFKDQVKFRLVYDIDDVIFFDHVPDFHYGKKKFKDPGSLGLSLEEVIEKTKEDEKYTLEIMEFCDEITVSTPFLKEFLSQRISNQNISIIPNKIPFFWAGNYYSEEIILKNYRKYKNQPRIIYAGSSSHVDCEEINDKKDDFFDIIESIIKTMKEFKWVFIGVCPPKLKEYTQTGEIEFWDWSPLALLPQTVFEREGNMMVAPLSDNVFNRAKSNIKFLEACAYGLPIACQDLNPYVDAPIKFKTGEQMIECIRKTLKTEENFLTESRRARSIADQNWLEVEENINLYKDIYTYPFGDFRRST
jgi:hypothetical protein